MRGLSHLTAKDRVWAAAVAITIVVLALLSAPVGIPLVETAMGKEANLFGPLLRALSSGSFPFSWLDTSLELVAKPSHWLSSAIWLLVVAAAVGLYALYERGSKVQRSYTNADARDSRLITSNRELKRMNDFWDGKGRPETPGGLVLGASRKGYFYDSSLPHYCCVGASGCGKTQFQVFQSLHLSMASGWNIITSGKAEIFELTCEKAASEGYRPYLLDLESYPGASRFNPVDLVTSLAEAGDIDRAKTTARQLAADIVPMGGETHTYFPRAARSMLAGAILVIALADIPREAKNMTSVCRLITIGTTAGEGKDPALPLKEFIRGENVGPDHVAYELFSDFLGDGGATTAGKNVLSTLKEAISIFSDGAISRATAVSDIPMRSIVEDKTIVYLSLMEADSPYLRIFTIFINQFWTVAKMVAAENAGRLPRETALILDEVGNIPRIDALPVIATLARSFGVHLYGWTQHVSQWKRYSTASDSGTGMDDILSCMQGKVALTLGLDEDAEFFSKLAGKVSCRRASASVQRGSSGRHSNSEGYSEGEEDLIRVHEWKNRSMTRDGLICIKGSSPSHPGREGVFQFKVDYACNTPAGEYFDIGNQAETEAKRISFYNRMLETHGSNLEEAQTWVPDFGEYKSQQSVQESIEEDEFSCWD